MLLAALPAPESHQDVVDVVAGVHVAADTNPPGDADHSADPDDGEALQQLQQQPPQPALGGLLEQAAHVHIAAAVVQGVNQVEHAVPAMQGGKAV